MTGISNPPPLSFLPLPLLVQDGSGSLTPRSTLADFMIMAVEERDSTVVGVVVLGGGGGGGGGEGVG